MDNIQEDLNGSVANFNFLSTGSHSAGVGVSLQMALNRSDLVKVSWNPIVSIFTRCVYLFYLNGDVLKEFDQPGAGECGDFATTARFLSSKLPVWNGVVQLWSFQPIVHDSVHGFRGVARPAWLPQNPHRNSCECNWLPVIESVIDQSKILLGNGSLWHHIRRRLHR